MIISLEALQCDRRTDRHHVVCAQL